MATKSSDQLNCFIFSGEKSGDRQGAAILHNLKEAIPHLNTFGVGGPMLTKEGLVPISDFKHFQVMGFKDVFLSLPKLLLEFRLIKKEILKRNPKFCIFIDSPDFSLRMQKSLRKKGYKGLIIQHVCPSIWAWKKERKKTLVDNVDLLTTLLPFEPDLFKDSSLKACFVGHPLTEQIMNFSPTDHQEPRGLLKSKEILSIFPGSRLGEIARNLPFQLKLAKSFITRHPKFSLAISCCRPELKSFIIDTAINNDFIEGKNFIILSERENYLLMQQSTLAIATSGTIALELGLFKVPTVICYELGYFDYLIAKYIFRISLPYYSLVNILLKKKLFPEHTGRKLSLKESLSDLQTLLDNRESIMDDLERLRKMMHKTKGSAKITSEAILELLDEN